MRKTCLILAVEPFHCGSRSITLGYGLFHGYSGQDGLFYYCTVLSAGFGEMNKCFEDSFVDPGHLWLLGCNISSAVRR